jgi:hypothetical protein
MALNEDLSLLITQLNELEKPSDQESLDSLIAHLGSFPSISVIEEALKYFKAKRDIIERTDIPLTLAEYGVRKVEMADGTSVHIDTFYETRQGNKELLADWVESNGYSDIIKDTLAFSKGEVDPQLLSFLSEGTYSFTRDSSINSQTLKKVLKDHVAAGGELPPSEAVQVTIFESAVVKRPKGGF